METSTESVHEEPRYVKVIHLMRENMFRNGSEILIDMFKAVTKALIWGGVHSHIFEFFQTNFF